MTGCESLIADAIRVAMLLLTLRPVGIEIGCAALGPRLAVPAVRILPVFISLLCMGECCD
jgi:hypothetical protein